MPEFNNTVELTEELDCDGTNELQCARTPPDFAHPPSRDPTSALGLRPPGDAASTIAGSVLRGRYVLDKAVGQGGTAVISMARDLQCKGASVDGPQVAIKLLRPELRDRRQSIARLRREFRQTHSLSHPNIVRFFELDCDRGTWFIAMELLAGEALGQRLQRTRPEGLPTRDAMSIATQCADALGFAHEHGVAHGDLKPDNVFVTTANEVRVLDFGVAPDLKPVAQPADAPPDEPIGPAATPGYASPEVLAGQFPGPRDDVFSLACMIYEMLAGRHPYGRLHANKACDSGLAIEPLPGLAPKQWRALAAGLAWRREQRPAGVRELMRTLGAEATERMVQPAAPLPVWAALGDANGSARKVWRQAVMAIAVTVVLGLLTSLVGFESRSGPYTSSRTIPAAAPVSLGADPHGGGTVIDADATAAADPEPVTEPARPRVRATTRSARVGFGTESMIVSRKTIAVAIPVRRLDHAGNRVHVGWRAIDGTAMAGRDYGGPRAGVADFAEGQAVRIIYVPVVNYVNGAGDRSFAVELTGASSRATLDSTRRIVVTIQDDV